MTVAGMEGTGKLSLMERPEQEHVFSDHLKLNGGYLFCEQVRIKDIQVELETLFPKCPSPAFVYSKAQVLDNVNAYKRGLEESGLPYQLGFSMKANFNPEIIKLMKEQGCSMVCVSGNEILLALRLGVEPSKVIYNGTGKYSWEIRLAVENDCLINADSLFDLNNLVTMAKELGKKVKVLLRVNPAIDPQVHPFLATGVAASKFGIDESQISEVLDVIREQRDTVELLGLHCHLGSTIDNLRVFKECLDVMMVLVDRVKKEGFPDIQYLNVGGGLGIDYTRHGERTSKKKEIAVASPEDTSNFIQLLQKRFRGTPTSYYEVYGMMSEFLQTGFFTASLDTVVMRTMEVLSDHPDLIRALNAIVPPLQCPVNIPGPESLVTAVTKKMKGTGMGVIFEPGRSLIGNAALLVSKVLGCKKNGNFKYMVVDASMSEVIRPSLYAAYHHIELTEPSQSAHLGKDIFDVVGPVCECSDFMGKERLLPYPHEGCGVAVFDTGAYCGSMGSNYNMRMRPAEILVDGESWRVIRRPDTLEDLLMPFHRDGLSCIGLN